MKIRKAAVLAIVIAALLPAAAFGTTSHATYALGKAKSCRADFVKRTETHKVKGKTVKYVACVYQAPKAKTTTTPPAPVKTIAPTPTKAPTVGATAPPADPPTAVTITADDSGIANAGDTVTYTVVVDHVLSATTGVLQVWDGTTELQNCSVPDVPTSPDANAEISGTCSETLTQPGTYHVSGVFTGDQVYAQAIGVLTETVLAPPAGPVSPPPSSGGGGGGSGGGNTGTTTTTTIPAPTTTTTLPPPPSTTTTTTLPPPPVVTPIAPTVTIADSAAQATVAGTVNVSVGSSAEWSEQSATPTGSASYAITDNGTTVTSGIAAINAGTFSFAWTPSTTDTYSVSVSYAGDANFTGANAGQDIIPSAAPYVPVVTNVTTTPSSVVFVNLSGPSWNYRAGFSGSTPTAGTVTLNVQPGPFASCSYNLANATSCALPGSIHGDTVSVTYSGASVVTDGQGDSTTYAATSATLTA